MQTTHKVEIQKYSSPLCWYVDSVGKRFKVVQYDGSDDHWLVTTSPHRLIRKEDCVVILSNVLIMRTPENAQTVLLDTKPKITIEDLRNTDHVGVIVDDGEDEQKGYVAFVGKDAFKLLLEDDTWGGCNDCYSEASLSVKGTLKDLKTLEIKAIFKFKTRKDLYKWLAE